MRFRSDFKVRADAGLFAFIGFSHTKDMSGCSSRRIANYHHAPSQVAKTNYAYFAVVLTCILDLKGEIGEDGSGILEIEAALLKRNLPLDRIVANPHEIL